MLTTTLAPAAARALLLVLALTASACLGRAGVTCDDGTLCPDQTACAVVGGQTRCVTADQQAVCADKPDEADCPLPDGSGGVCHDAVCVRAGCGDGFVRAPEQCDSANLGTNDVSGPAGVPDGAIDCLDLGYYTAGALTCLSDCTFDRNGCNNAGRCGDGVVNGDEQCDGTALNGNTCRAGGFYDDGDLRCNSACRFDFVACGDRCGDGRISGPEECDGAALGPETCTDLGFYGGGSLRCLPNCAYDRSVCVGTCGDGVLQPAQGEACDGAALGTETCQSLGFYGGGPLSCLPSCAYDRSACTGSCGDGIVQADQGEACDGDVGTATCATLGFYGGGPLTCAKNCAYDSSACQGSCGDGVLQPAQGESCDGAELGGATCASLGFYGGGPLGCLPSCSFDRSQCVGRCGDGMVQPTQGEACDGSQFAALNINGDGVFDCRDVLATSRPGNYYQQGAVGCFGNCQLDLGACTGYCGDGQKNGAEACDGNDFGAATCTTSGFYSGSLQCAPDCKAIVTSGCRGTCGDGVRNGAEVCDGPDVGTASCAALGFYSGTVGCAPSCGALVTSACAGTFGDGAINGGEVCDGSGPVFPAGVSCGTYGYYGDETPLVCASAQAIDASGCAAEGYCGDGLLQEGEACDGAEQGGLDCGVVGARGPLDCDSRCQLAFGTCEDSVWKTQRVPAGVNPIIVRDLWSGGAASAWVVGEQGYVAQWDGQRWRDRSIPNVFDALSAVWGDGNAVWAAPQASSRVYRLVWDDPGVPASCATPIIDGACWAFETLPTIGGQQVAINDLYGEGGTLYAATSFGVLVRSPAGTWSVAVAGQEFTAIHGRDGVVMAVGNTFSAGQSNLARFIPGAGWSRLTVKVADTEQPYELTSVSVLAADHALFTSSTWRDAILDWGGGYAWRTTMGTLSGNPEVVGVYGAAPDDVWALARQSSPDRLILVHWSGYVSGFNGVTVIPATLPVPFGPIGGLVGFGAGNVWALVGDQVAHYEGPGPRQASLRQLRDANNYSAPDRFINDQDLERVDFASIAVARGVAWMGANCQGVPGCSGPALFEHRLNDLAFDRYTPRPMAVYSNLLGGDATAMTIDAAGWLWVANGADIRAMANTRAPRTAPPPPPAFSMGIGYTGRAAQAVGASTLFAYDGNGSARLAQFNGATWSSSLITDGFLPFTSVTALAAASPTDVWVADRGRLAHWNGVGWGTPAQHLGGAPVNIPFDTVTGMQFVTPDELWITGTDVMRSRGAMVRLVRTSAGFEEDYPSVSDGASVSALTGVWGASARDVWMVGAASEALHWDGTRLSRIALPRGGLVAIAGSGPDDVWAVGADGVVLRVTHPLPSTTSGACPDAAPVYCAEASQTLVGAVPAGETVYYRLVSPISAGLAPGALTAEVASLGAGAVELAIRPGRAVRSMCGPPRPTSGTSFTEPLLRGDWRYVGVHNPEATAQAFSLTVGCTLTPP